MDQGKYWQEDIKICTQVDSGHDFNGAMPMNPGIVMTSCFAFPSYQHLSEAIKQERKNCVYSRGTNPTVQILEKKLAQLERAEECRCFASGMAGITAVLFSLLQSGDHVLVVNNIYGPVLQYLNHISKNNITFDHLTEDISPAAVEKAIKSNTKLIYFESPATMTFRQVDMQKICDLAKSKGILTMTDNTWATPLFQKPILFGVDIVAHSLTKYIGGASDLVGGAIMTRSELMEKIFPVGYLMQGGVMSSFVAYLCLRGLLSLPLRMKQHEESGLTVANFLQKQKKVASVNHPALREEDKGCTQKYLLGFSGLFSFALKSEDFTHIAAFIDHLKHFKKAVSWGGFESLAISPHFGKYDEIKNKGIPKGIIRISVGLEPVELLIKDLEFALKNM